MRPSLPQFPKFPLQTKLTRNNPTRTADTCIMKITKHTQRRRKEK